MSYLSNISKKPEPFPSRLLYVLENTANDVKTVPETHFNVTNLIKSNSSELKGIVECSCSARCYKCTQLCY